MYVHHIFVAAYVVHTYYISEVLVGLRL